MCIECSEHASSFSAADGRKWTAEKGGGERERGLARPPGEPTEVRSRAIHEFGRREGKRRKERERERQFEFRRKLGGRAISKS